MLARTCYWGKPAVRNFRGNDGDVGIIRRPVRAIALPGSNQRARHPFRPIEVEFPDLRPAGRELINLTGEFTLT
jgi:hypothetical protein